MKQKTWQEAKVPVSNSNYTIWIIPSIVGSKLNYFIMYKTEDQKVSTCNLRTDTVFNHGLINLHF